MLKLRDSTVLTQIDRDYIRSLTGGVSKFIFGLFQEKLKNLQENLANVPSPIFDSLFQSTQDICSLANSWHSPEENKDPSNDDECIWESSYFEKHSYRPIWKVNSHQLNEDGTGINNKRRYRKLIPNLSILSTNHHADFSTDVVKTFTFEPPSISTVSSHLRYFFTLDGATIDRHTSQTLSKYFALERVKRLKTKATQGLLWRWFDDVKISWDMLDLHRGWLRSLLGLSRTHTRSLYKSDFYRSDCKSFIIDKCDDTEFIKNLQQATKTSCINLLSGCMWCNDSLISKTKGNRKHALLSCTNVELRKFRMEMTQLINSKLITFFRKILHLSSHNCISSILREIEVGFCDLQLKNIGRLKKVPHHRNNIYISTKNLLHKWEISKEQLSGVCINDNCLILSEIIGLLPNPHTHIYYDDELGIIDAPWLGMIPCFLDNCIIRSCKKLDGTITHAETMQQIAITLLELWGEIKDLIMGKAIGLHRIIGTTGHTYEKEMTKFHQTKQEKTVEPVICTVIDEPCKSSSVVIHNIRKESPSLTFDTPKHPSKKRKTVNPSYSLNDTPAETKMCIGITCGRDRCFWHGDSAFLPNTIKKSIKQCGRCSRYMTAMRKVSETLENMIDLQINQGKNTAAIQKTIKFCKDNQETLQYKYAPFMNMLDTFLHDDMRMNKAISTNKTSDSSPRSNKNKPNIYERQKLFSRLLQKCIIQATRTTDNPLSILTNAHNFSKLTRQRSLDTISVHSSCSSPSSPTAANSLTVPEAIEASGTSWLSGMAITKAMDVIRSWNAPDMYIGHGDSTTMFNNWTHTQQWTVFGRIFKSERILTEKPHGIYFIPIFSGAVQAGHWHLVVVQKSHRSCTGWILDSLNTEHEHSESHRKIETAFCPGRSRCTWHRKTCRLQTELECGIRVIYGVMKIIHSIRDGHNFQVALHNASLESIPTEDYVSTTIRGEVASLIDTHRQDMIITLSRRRRRNQIRDESSNQKRLKRRKRKALTPVDAISIEEESRTTQNTSTS